MVKKNSLSLMSQSKITCKVLAMCSFSSNKSADRYFTRKWSKKQNSQYLLVVAKMDCTNFKFTIWPAGTTTKKNNNKKQANKNMPKYIKTKIVRGGVRHSTSHYFSLDIFSADGFFKASAASAPPGEASNHKTCSVSWFCRSLPGQQGVLPTVPVVQLMAISTDGNFKCKLPLHFKLPSMKLWYTFTCKFKAPEMKV